LKIVYQHIPKCAGTSIHKVLQNNLDNSLFHPERLNNLECHPIASLIEKQVFSGHYDSWRVGLVPGPKFVFTFFREPKARVISLYNFWRSHKWDFINKHDLNGPRIAKENSLSEFLKIKNQGIPGNIDNIYVRLALGRSQSEDIDNIIQNDEEKAVHLALRYYQSLDFIGITEQSEYFVDKLCCELNLSNRTIFNENKCSDVTISSAREKVDKIEITNEAEKLLTSNTRLDTIIYNHFNSVS